MSNVPLGNFNAIGPLGNTNNFNGGPLATSFWLARVISLIIGILTLFAGIWFIFQMFIGAFNWLSSGSDKNGVENAKKRITNAAIGLAIVVFSYAIIDIVGRVLGLPILSIRTVLPNLRP